MDSSLTQLVSVLARNLLSISPRVELQIPKSQHNGIYALNLLSSLGEVARLHLEEPAPAQPKPAPAVTEQRIVLTPAPAISTSNRLNLKDKNLLEALMKLRDTHSSFKRHPGTYSTILRTRPS